MANNNLIDNDNYNTLQNNQSINNNNNNISNLICNDNDNNVLLQNNQINNNFINNGIPPIVQADSPSPAKPWNFNSLAMSQSNNGEIKHSLLSVSNFLFDIYFYICE